MATMMDDSLVLDFISLLEEVGPDDSDSLMVLQTMGSKLAAVDTHGESSVDYGDSEEVYTSRNIDTEMNEFKEADAPSPKSPRYHRQSYTERLSAPRRVIAKEVEEEVDASPHFFTHSDKKMKEVR